MVELRDSTFRKCSGSILAPYMIVLAFVSVVIPGNYAQTSGAACVSPACTVAGIQSDPCNTNGYVRCLRIAGRWIRYRYTCGNSGVFNGTKCVPGGSATTAATGSSTAAATGSSTAATGSAATGSSTAAATGSSTAATGSSTAAATGSSTAATGSSTAATGSSTAATGSSTASTGSSTAGARYGK